MCQPMYKYECTYALNPYLSPFSTLEHFVLAQFDLE